MFRWYVPILALCILFCCSEDQVSFHEIEEFTKETNEALENFLHNTKKVKGRKVAVFDGDGTVMGQAPHYLADECLYQYALQHREKNPRIISAMRTLSNVSIPYVQYRVRYFSGDSVVFLRKLGDRCYREYYAGKVFIPMKKLIRLLRNNGFEVWIVTASPEAMYQLFLSRELGLPVTNIIGVKSVVRNGIITDRIVEPVPQDNGKKEAIETFVQEAPLLVAGNSRGDKEMIEFSRGVRMIINPDEHVAPDQEESIAQYARRNNWIIERIQDEPASDFPSVSSKKYGIRINKTQR